MKIPRIVPAIHANYPLRLALGYLLYGTLWIMVSDLLLDRWLGEEARYWIPSAAKGFFFILTTAGLFYLLVKRLVDRYDATDAALRESKMRWRFALEGSGDGLWDWNIETGRVFYSQHWKSMLGYAAEDIGNSMSEWESRVHPDDLAQTKADLADHLNGKSPVYRSEHRLRTKDGGYKWILDRALVVSRSPSGSPLRIIGTHVDISLRKTAQARMADALSFATAVIHSSPTGVTAYALDGNAVIANEAAARILGTDVASLLKQNFRELESWKRHGLLDAANQALSTGKEVIHAGFCVSTFGRQLWLETRMAPFEYAGNRHLLVLVEDKTEKHEAIENLRLMEAAVQAAPVGWMVTDLEGRVKRVNPAFTALTGYTAEEMLDRNPRLLKSGRHTATFYADMWATIKRGEVWSGEMFNHRKSGELYHESMTIAPIKDLDGTVRHYVAIKADITERKNLEKQLARAQRLESVGMLASGIAHDLNNIFAPILLSIELLKVKYPAADAARTLDIIEAAGQRGAGIVRQVLTFARGIEGERASVQPKYLVKEAAQILGETLPRNIRVETKLAHTLPPVLADATQLHQVLLNLAINARDAMPSGGRLVLGAEVVAVDEARAARNPPIKPGSFVALTVADNGSGIAPDVLEHMFEPFFTTKPLGKGTGLGLSTVYGIVRGHGGSVEVSTELGAGTVFTILLPALEVPGEAGETRRSVAQPLAGVGRRILVVDDEETIRVITSHALEQHGFVVEAAADGAEALAVFKADPTRFAAVVTDLMMPQMNGRQLAGEIRRLAPRLPILVSSGLADEGGNHHAGDPGLADVGVRTLLRKPYKEAELIEALRRELDAPQSGAGQKNG